LFYGLSIFAGRPQQRPCFSLAVLAHAHPFLQYKRSRKMSSNPIDDTKRAFLTSLLQVILTKMKWDPDADPDDIDEDDNAEFDKMRKVLIAELCVSVDPDTLLCRNYEHSWTQFCLSTKISLLEPFVHWH
jgi:Exportin-T